MTEKIIKRTLLYLLCVSAWFITGCIGEDRDDCPEIYTLVVKAYDIYNRELFSEEVVDISLFVFDSNGVFLERVETRTHEAISIQNPTVEPVHLVAWGNVTHEYHAYSAMSPGDTKDRGFLYLLPDPRSEFLSLSPNDLFWGEIDISGKEPMGESVVLPVYRQVGSLSVTVRGLKAFTGNADDDYSVVVRGSCSVLDFFGQLSGDQVIYWPAGTYTIADDDQDEFHVPPFRLFPETGAITIDIYRGSQLITSVSENADGTSIAIQTEMQTNVLIDLKAIVSVSVSLTSWGEEHVWKEF